MSVPLQRLRGAACGFFLLACGHPKIPEQPAPPCGLTSASPMLEDPRFLKDLSKYADNPPEPTPPATKLTLDELDAHCRDVWGKVVESRHCGEVELPALCEQACKTEAEKTDCSTGNGRGRVAKLCNEASLATFTKNYPLCAEFVLCNGALQAKSKECKPNEK